MEAVCKIYRGKIINVDTGDVYKDLGFYVTKKMLRACTKELLADFEETNKNASLYIEMNHLHIEATL